MLIGDVVVVGMTVGEVGMLILQAETRSSFGFIREIDLVRNPPLIDEEPPCEGLNARD